MNETTAAYPARVGLAGGDVPSTPAEAAVPAVELSRVTHRYGDAVAVDDVSISVGSGDLVTLLGPSGSGKTTVLNLVAGAFAPSEGAVAIKGVDLTDVPANKRNIGMVFQSYTLFPGKNVAQNVAFPLSIRKVPQREIERRVQEALRMVHLESFAKQYPAQLSGGQAQRVALARAMVFRPAIMLFDEPLGALDRALRTELQHEIRRIQQETEVAALYVTHDQEEALSISDRIVLFRDGRVIQHGTPREVYDSPCSVWAATFLGEANVFEIDSAEPADSGQAVLLRTHGVAVQFATTSDEWSFAKNAVVRPEDCVVSEVRTAPSQLRGEIQAVEYRGATQRLTIKLEGGPAILATTPGRAVAWARGKKCYVSWRDESVSFVRS